jgi:signal transduction histidine kinase
MTIIKKFVSVLLGSIIILLIVFSVYAYERERAVFLSGVDKKLYAATIMYREILGEHYHDELNANSFSAEDYDRIVVDRANKLCDQLGLQYIWSNMIVDGNIVFTSSVSPSHDVTKKDHAKFFDVHNDPHAFDVVFKTMKPDYSSFENEWGHGRMVLTPFVDENGRPYVFGASISVAEVDAFLWRILQYDIYVAAIAFLLLSIFSILVFFTLSKPIVKLTESIELVARGNLEVEIDSNLQNKRDEIGELARQFNKMTLSLKKTRLALNKSIAELDKRVKERTAELSDANKQLRSLDAMKDDFLNVTTHELKTPLIPIKAQSQLLLSGDFGELNAEQKKSLEMIYRNEERLSQLASDVLDITKIQSQKLKLLPEKTRLQDIIKTVLEDFSPLSKEKKQMLVSDVSALPALMIDSRRIVQVLGNLLSNAVKFTPEGGEIKVVAKVDRKNIVVSISDSGIGIDEKDMGKLFVPFSQIDASITKKHGGTGLGLAICKGIVEAHGGKIWAESAGLGQGSVFSFSLPIKI